MNYQKVKEITEDSGVLLKIDHNLGSDDDLDNVRHFIFNPHGKPSIAKEEDFHFDPEAIPDEFSRFKELMRSELGLLIAKFSQYQADGGADEIGQEILNELRHRHQGALMITPKLIGRGVLDLNRPKKLASGDSLFSLPQAVTEDLGRIFDISYELVFRVFLTLAAKNLKSVTQPHTMASGGRRQGETVQLSMLASQLRQSEEGNSEPLYQNPEIAQALIKLWEEVSTNMNDRRDRPAIDIINAVKPEQAGKLQNLLDGGISLRFAQELERIKVPYVFNKPYEYLPEYPGTELAAHAGHLGLQQLTIDVPRHLLQSDPRKFYDVLTFQPDRKKVRKIALAIVNSL